jgi:hypothetical protein
MNKSMGQFGLRHNLSVNRTACKLRFKFRLPVTLNITAESNNQTPTTPPSHPRPPQ